MKSLIVILGLSVFTACSSSNERDDGSVFPMADAGLPVAEAGATIEDAPLVELGTMWVHKDPASPVGRQLVMGTRGVEIFRYYFEGGPEEDVDVTSLYHGMRTSSFPASVTNPRLVDVATGIEISGALNSTHILFEDIRGLRIPRDGRVVLKLVVDIPSFADGGVSGQRIQPILSKCALGSGGGSPCLASIQARGVETGMSLDESRIHMGSGSVDGVISGGEFTIYRTVLSVVIDRERPPSMYPGLEHMNQNVARYTLTNSDNEGAQSASVEFVLLSLLSTIRATGDVSVRIWWATPTIPEAEIAQLTIPAGRTLTVDDVRFGCRGCASMLAIPSGSWQLITVSVNTLDAIPGDTLRADLLDLRYSDGVTNDIPVEQVPILGNILGY